MVELHRQSNVVDNDQSAALVGALKYKDMQVSEVMTPIDKVYMISHEATLR
jgi:CBS domain containing-hemolysin-like protein